MNWKNWACTALSGAVLLGVGTTRAQEGPPPAPDVMMRAGGPGAVSYTHLDVYKRQVGVWGI